MKKTQYKLSTRNAHKIKKKYSVEIQVWMISPTLTKNGENIGYIREIIHWLIASMFWLEI